MLTVESRSTILDTAALPIHERIAFFTSLCRLQSGVVICGFQIGPCKHAASSTIGLCISSDEGRSWERLPTRFETVVGGVPGELGTAELIEVSPGRLLLFSTWFDRSEPDRPLFDPVTEGILHSKQLMAVSSDHGRSWSPWRQISTGDLKGCALTGPCVRWHDGRIAMAFESFKEFDDLAPGRHAAWAIISEDGGQSFSEPLQVAQHPDHSVYYWDQRLCLGAHPGEWTALFWTHDLAGKTDLNVHLRHGRVTSGPPIELERSVLKSTSIPGQIAAPLWCDDGRLLAFVVDRNSPGTMTLWSSSDAGETWPVEQRLVVHVHQEHAALTQGQENIDFRLYWEDMAKWSFGHPAICRIDAETVLLAWYAGSPDCMSLHSARVGIA